MNDYAIYVTPRGNYIAIKQGWSWTAFFLNWMWAISKGMWKLGLTSLILVMLLAYIYTISVKALGEGSVFDTLASIILIIYSIFFGAFGNRWREDHLLRQIEYNYREVVSARSQREAIEFFMKDSKD